MAKPTALGACYLVEREGYEQSTLDALDELWATDLFKRCDRPSIEYACDHVIFRFDVYSSNNRSFERILALDELGFEYKGRRCYPDYGY